MPMDEAKYRELLERIDPKLKLKRLQEELDGNEEKGIIGLREQLMLALRSMESQGRLVQKRASQRDSLKASQLDLFDRGQAEAELNLKMYEMQAEYLGDEIIHTEAQLEDLKMAGLRDPEPLNGNRATRRAQA